MTGKLFNRRVEIDVPHGHGRDLQPLADLGAEAGHQQGMGAEIVEEIVFDRSALDLHDLGERGRERLLGMRSAGRRTSLVETEKRGPLGGGRFLRSALLLAVIGIAAQLFEVARDHVGRQLFAQRLRYFARRDLRAPLLRV